MFRNRKHPAMASKVAPVISVNAENIGEPPMRIYDGRRVLVLIAAAIASFVLLVGPASAGTVYDLTATPAPGNSVGVPAFSIQFTDQNSDGLLSDADIINGFSGVNQYDVLVGIPTITGFTNGSAPQWAFSESINPALGTGISPSQWTYSINQQIAAVPESSTWAMLLLGFAGLWHLSRRRSSRARRHFRFLTHKANLPSF
jgi:hypothetical protein